MKKALASARETGAFFFRPQCRDGDIALLRRWDGVRQRHMEKFVVRVFFVDITHQPCHHVGMFRSYIVSFAYVLGQIVKAGLS